MNSRRDHRGVRSSLFDGLEEGIKRASASYTTHEISEHENDRELDGLQDRVSLLKRLTSDIHAEVDSQNRILDHMGNQMDISKGMLFGTVGRFKKVFEAKSSRSYLALIGSFIMVFLLVYFLVNII
ncbi:hypothetical protein KP509_15G058500 [Ceratopteris richardii]|uniref:t-SNARE coiled-coil homology domain-containing protein n=1 Tax=Ceratopteris richardii TaxID=49495 RepID=A0A8T2T3T9_CERRI|nr:hypothetical protein KP509_15G058500 [Ceratopteris richardii]